MVLITCGQGMFDEDQLDNPGGDFARMLTEGLDVSVDANPDKLRHKVIVIDWDVPIWGNCGSLGIGGEAYQL